MYRCEHCSAVFTTRKQWCRHARIHTRFACRWCEHICANHAELQQHLATHLATTSTQTGSAEATLATQVLTPTKYRAKRVTPYVAYRTAKMEDPLGLLESSDNNDKSGNDPRADR